MSVATQAPTLLAGTWEELAQRAETWDQVSVTVAADQVWDDPGVLAGEVTLMRTLQEGVFVVRVESHPDLLGVTSPEGARQAGLDLYGWDEDEGECPWPTFVALEGVYHGSVAQCLGRARSVMEACRVGA